MLWGAMGCDGAQRGAMGCYGLLWGAAGCDGALRVAMGRSGALWGAVGQHLEKVFRA